jgi:hypothetical protein
MGRVDAQLGRVLGQVGQRGVAVLQPGREGVLGSEPVLDRYDDRLRGGGELPGPGVLAVDAADDEAAAVDVQQPGLRAAGGEGSVAAHRHVRCPRRPGHDPVGDGERHG